MSAYSSTSSAANRVRKTVANKDENVRKKLEKEVSRSTSSMSLTKGTSSSSSAAANINPNALSNAVNATNVTGLAGTVSKLKPNSPILVNETISITNAAKLMATKRADAILIVDTTQENNNNENANVIGILTDKDIAYRVVASNLNANETAVGQVMTRHPTSVTSSTEASEALLKMAQGRFRHLPVIDGGDHIVGVLDIIKCLYETTSKLEKAYESAKSLFEAMQTASYQWNSLHSADSEAMMENLRARMSCPPISEILDTDSPPPIVTPKSTVRDAAKLMKQEHASAVLVVENVGNAAINNSVSLANSKVVGIFTSKDVVLRVIGNGLDPDLTSIVRVMTPHPTTVLPDCSVLDALKMMQNGRYLHLPVVREDQTVFGLLDVLTLTYSTLGQVDNMEKGGNPSNKPKSNSGTNNKGWQTFWNTSLTLAAEELNKGPIIGAPSDSHYSDAHHTGSMIDDNFESVSMLSGSALEEDSGMGSFVFKFKAQDGTVHRFSSKNGDLKALREAVAKKLEKDVSSLPNIKYQDEEGDFVILLTDDDLFDAVTLARNSGWKRINLSLEGVNDHEGSDNDQESVSNYDSKSDRKRRDSKTRKEQKLNDQKDQQQQQQQQHQQVQQQSFTLQLEQQQQLFQQQIQQLQQQIQQFQQQQLQQTQQQQQQVQQQAQFQKQLEQLQQQQQQQQSPVQHQQRDQGRSGGGSDKFEIHPNYLIAGLGVTLLLTLIYAIRK